MTLPFCERVINDGEITPKNFRNTNFIGYLSPNGQVIDCSMPFGLGGHDINPTTEIFKQYLYLKEINREQYDEFYEYFNDKCALEQEKKRTTHYLRELQPEMDRYKTRIAKYGLYDDPYDILDNQVLEFFYNCYSNELFSVGFNGNNTIMTKPEFYEKYFQPIDEKRKRLYPRKSEEDDTRYWWRVPPYYHFDVTYNNYKRKRTLEIIKDVMVSYLGYHYVARTPRTIYTSDFRVYETFYNYLLNDYTIYQIPKMNYDNEKRQYVEQVQNEFLIPDSELRLKQEIESTKRLVPFDKRYQYYR